MREFERKRNISKFVYSIPVAIILLILVLVMIKASWGVYQKKIASHKAVALATQEVDSLKERKSFFESEIEYLNTPEGIEAELRERFRVGKDGEEIAVILDEEKTNQASNIASSASSTNGLSDSFYKKILGLFGF